MFIVNHLIGEMIFTTQILKIKNQRPKANGKKRILDKNKIFKSFMAFTHVNPVMKI